jgi:hypothetical protein
MRLRHFTVSLLCSGLSAFSWAGMDQGAAAYEEKSYALALTEM